MTKEEIYSKLCYYDLRNPDGVADAIKYASEIYEDEVEDFGNHSKSNCGCDNCFYGRTQLAEILIDLINLYQIPQDNG